MTDQIWRGAQPNRLGIEFLKSIEITDVINLRQATDCWPAENRLVLDAGMNYANLQMNGISKPDPDEIELILTYIKNAIVNPNRKVFIHCQHGCDRTGTIVACYRIRFEGWTPAQAQAEADIYDMSGLELGMREFIEHFK